MKIHKEGYNVLFKVIAILLIINGLLVFFSNWEITVIVSFFSLLFLFFNLRFFRVPEREFFTDKNAIISPADGEIVVIEKTREEEYFKDERIQISVFMSVWDVHINWFPISGIVRYFKYHPGKYLVARYPKSSKFNERTSVVVETSKGQQVLFRQIAGIVARRIISYVSTGARVEQSKESGFIRFGSRLDVFLPLQARINVSMNEKVKGGQTVLATWE